jgi:hypothetical protein
MDNGWLDAYYPLGQRNPFFPITWFPLHVIFYRLAMPLGQSANARKQQGTTGHNRMNEWLDGMLIILWRRSLFFPIIWFCDFHVILYRLAMPFGAKCQCKKTTAHNWAQQGTIPLQLATIRHPKL